MNDSAPRSQRSSRSRAPPTPAINDIGTLQDVLIGVALGTLIGKFLVRRLERRSGSELPAARV